MTDKDSEQLRRAALERAGDISRVGYLTEKESIAYAYDEHPDISRKLGADMLSAELPTYDELVRTANSKVNFARRTVEVIDG